MPEQTKDLRVQRTTRNLKRALQQLLWHQRLEEVKVQDICARAMVHRATFYAHYQDKYHLFQEILDDIAAEIEGNSRPSGPGVLPRQLYLQTAARAIDYVSRHREHLRDTLRSNKDSMAYFMIYNAAQDFITNLLKQYQQVNDYLLPVEVISRFTTAGLTGLVFYWVESDAPYTKQEMRRMLQTIITHNHYIDRKKSRKRL
ncbi:TetR/AcrR family transcriptional regulator [Spirochaeta africana]|uniref:Transcriptional regulator n=1 Tax=Spirochaeta africana (strain ATCC 700263 / DSM 8902 / Z-7692) TaxID=889378 RepID=H9UL18_SPIAZ|nr:TetR-like C-terminal domain-containing protein [Spirochaeta africana]AFG38211.1 transcriptional regulator [Spirochaeta africana DSM 8902]